MEIEPRFTLLPATWYALELIGDDFLADDRRYAPVLVERVEQPEANRLELTLGYDHQHYPAGGLEPVYRLQVLEHARRYLLARSLTHSPARLLLISTLTEKWLSEKLQIYARKERDEVQKRFARV